MSALQKSIVKNKLPPKCPKTSGIPKLAPFGASRRKDYTPVSWKQYFDRFVDVETECGVFRVYLSPEPDHPEQLRIVTLHGGGYSGLSWALFTEEITSMINCQVVSMDIRGHGETKATEPDDLSADTLARDVEQVLHKLFEGSVPPLILVGHSMGGAIAVRVAHSPALEQHVDGLAVIDVVEGTAMDALASMQSFLRGRPTHFKSIEHAIEWCVRSGQVRNVDSARVSMPSQIVNCETGLLATSEVESYTPVIEDKPSPNRHVSRADSIAEEGEEGLEGEGMPGGRADMNQNVGLDGGGRAEGEKEEGEEFVKPGPVGDGNTAMKYSWRIDLSKTESHWSGWFAGLSARFLSTRAPRLLLLASIDGLDRQLTVGQMQGKFQMQVLTRCGHAVHEDSPAEVARVIAAFALRHRLTTATDNGTHMNLVAAPENEENIV